MKKLTGIIFLAICVFFVGCSSPSSGGNSTKSSRENPLLPGQMAKFNSMSTSDRGFEAEVTLLDIYRGDISANYITFSDPIGADQEVIVAKFDLNLLKSVNDLPLNYPDNYFSLVSGESKAYPNGYYYTSGKAKKDLLFVDMYPGGEEIAHVLFAVDKNDTDPFIVFNSKSDTPIWFKTNLTEKERLSEDQQIVLSDFGIKGEGVQEGLDIEGVDFTKTYGGSLSNPLIIGDWAFYNYAPTYNTDSMDLEVQLLEYVEEKDAEKMAYGDTSSRNSYNSIDENEKLVGFKFKMNLVEYESSYSADFSPNFEIIDTSGKTIESKSYFYGADSSILLNSMYEGGTQEGWYFTYIPKSATNVRISYKEYDVPSIWFTTDSSMSGSEKKYKPVYDPTSYGIDPAEELGSFRNPAGIGELVEVDVNEKNNNAAYNMELTGVIVGKEAEEFLGKKGKDTYAAPAGYQYVVANFSFVVTRTEGDEVFKSNTYNVTPIADAIDYSDYSPSLWKAEGQIQEVYPSEEKNDGFVAFLIPSDTKELKILFTPLYSMTGSSCYKYDFAPSSGVGVVSNNEETSSLAESSKNESKPVESSNAVSQESSQEAATNSRFKVI